MHRREALIVFALSGLLLTGCEHPRYYKAGESGGTTAVSAASFFGAANIHMSMGQCAGRVALAQGQATVHDNCFTGETNVVVCTDATTASPVKCAPAPGALTIAGSGSDVISYARLR